MQAHFQSAGLVDNCNQMGMAQQQFQQFGSGAAAQFMNQQMFSSGANYGGLQGVANLGANAGCGAY